MFGAGLFGRFAIQAYAATGDIHVLAVADDDEASLLQVQAAGAHLTSDWLSILGDDRIEVVHVATPPFARAELVCAALGAGKSVFCEKPLALTVQDADVMIEQANRHGVVLGIDYVMRYQPAYRFLASLSASGLAGAPRSLSFQNFAQTVPRTHWFWDRSLSGGIFVEHGVHFFDIFGVVAGAASRVAGRQPRDTAVEATVWYRDGVVGRFYHEFNFPLEVEFASGVVAFEQGHVVIDGWIPTRLTGVVQASPEAVAAIGSASGVDLTLQVGDAVSFQATFLSREQRYRDAIVAGMRDLIRRHRDPNHALRVTAEDGRASLALALASQRACDTDRSVDVIARSPG
jgi:predicted dehydrogenase